MASDPFLVGVLFGFVPAMGFLYILLHNYQRFFEEKRVFKTFFVGLIAGFLIAVVESLFGPGAALNPEADDALALAGIVLIALLFGLFETMVAMAVLNWRSFRVRKDTAFYGASFGLGVGAVIAVFVVGRSVPVLTAGATGWTEVFLLIMLGLYFMGAILMHAGAYVWVGQGVVQRDLIVAGTKSTLALAGYTLVFFLLPRLPDALANVVPVLALAGAIAFIGYILRTVLDQVVPVEVLREAGIHRRRLARRRMRETSSEQAEDAGTGLEDETVPDERRE